MTKIMHEDNKLMVLQLKDDSNGPVWRQAQWQSRRRSSQLLMPIPRGGERPDGGLVVARVANKQESRAIAQGNVVVGQMEEKGP